MSEQTFPWRVRRGAWFNGRRILGGWYNGEWIPLAFFVDAANKDTFSFLETVKIASALITNAIARLIHIVPLGQTNLVNAVPVTLIDTQTDEEEQHDFVTSGAENNALVFVLNTHSAGGEASVESQAEAYRDLVTVVDAQTDDMEYADFEISGWTNATNKEWLEPYTDADGFLVIQQAWNPAMSSGWLEME
jgi:hypothetical protein